MPNEFRLPNEKKDFFNIAELSRQLQDEVRKAGVNVVQLNTRDVWMISAMLAQAQQMAVIAGRLDEIASYLGEIVSKAKGTT